MTMKNKVRGLCMAVGFTSLAAGLLVGCGSEPLSSEELDAEAQAAPGAKGATYDQDGNPIITEKFNTEDGEIELTYSLIDGRKVFEGDIILPDGPEYRSGGVSAMGARWPHGVVYYESTGLFNDARITAAIKHWEDRTPLRFVGGATTGNRIKFASNTTGVCESPIGMVGGQQVITLASGCGTSAVIHEIGHSIGLFHEQSRSDRDSFVSVNTGCVLAGKTHNFNKFTTDGWNIGPYDTTSIMHYSSNAFVNTAKAGCTSTITLLNGNWINGTSVLSPLDIAGVRNLYQSWMMPRQMLDYDLDKKADLAVYRPGDGHWHMRSSINNVAAAQVAYGRATDIPVLARWDGDGRPDIAIFRPTDGNWHRRMNLAGTKNTAWGTNGDLPVPGDYDGDGITDMTVWRPSDGFWHVLRSRDGGVTSQQWGAPGDVPVPGDYDGDGKTDFAVWRPSDGFWHVILSNTNTISSTQWGVASDLPVLGDFDGDGKLDKTIYRRTDGTWWILPSSGAAAYVAQWGIGPSDMPIPGKFDDDNKTDLAVFRPSDGFWHIFQSKTNTVRSVQYGQKGDVPM
jgi:hypothetical protein